MNKQHIKNGKVLLQITSGNLSRLLSHWGRHTEISAHELSKKLDEVEIGAGFKSCSFDYKGRRVRLSGKHAIPLAIDIFGLNQYEFLKGEKTIVDIGANIGDTAIYFALNGTEKVYAFEPYPYSFRMMKKNLAESGMNGNIETFMAGLGSASGAITLTEDEIGAEADLVAAKEGKNIPITTLDEIAKRHNLKDASLKIDCDGDVDIINGASDDTLLRFRKIELETAHAEQIAKRFDNKNWKVVHEMKRRDKGNKETLHNCFDLLMIERVQK